MHGIVFDSVMAIACPFAYVSESRMTYQNVYTILICRRSDYIIGFVTPTSGNNLLSMKPCMLFFIQTLPRTLCAGAISRVSFMVLFGPVAVVTNPIM